MTDVGRSLKNSGINSTETEIILANILRKDRSFLNAHPETKLAKHLESEFELKCKRRLAGEPLSYVLGSKEFYGLKFYVDKNVLIPRPETEDLVERVIKYAKDKEVNIADVGTGSGCIAVSLAKNLPLASIFATDIDERALRVAKRNAKLHHMESRINFSLGNLLSSIEANLDIIVANLPYIKTEKLAALEPEIKDWEPRRALDGGADGMSLYNQLFQTAPKKSAPRSRIFYEFDGKVFQKNS